jgi:hypothetical protein
MGKKKRGGTRKSLKNPATYDALRRDHPGMSKKTAAKISNGVLLRGVKKGKHHRKGKGK